ncbi:MAG: TraF peptidase [Hyphomicrobiales bacterium]|nr:TraF peptidase [Hyphomicrobiales bacterium]
MSRLNRFMAGTAIVGAAILLLGAGCYAIGARVNTSKSIPVGLYWTSSAPVEKGAYVLFCPPEVGVFVEARKRGYLAAGFCPGGNGYMMKRVSAATNDRVSIATEGVRVNGQLLPFSVPLATDRAGRQLPRFQASRFVLGDSEVLLMSDVSDTSFDGRYFGPVNRTQIRTVIMPVFTW